MKTKTKLVVAVANNGGAMESETIKNGASSKSLIMSRVNFLKRVCFALLVAGVIGFSINACTDASARGNNSAKLEQWEYKMVELDLDWERKDDLISNSNKLNILNNLGVEGWELVSVTRMAQYGGGSYLFTLKRKLP